MPSVSCPNAEALPRCAGRPRIVTGASCGVRRLCTVFGEGPAGADLMLVGEQPGDREDVSGHPFVGPPAECSTRVSSLRASTADTVYLTNAVKHFRWKARGKRRLHERPARSHVVACRPWLFAELEEVAPRVLVLMGAVAAQSLLGAGFSVLRQRGVVEEPAGALARGCRHGASVIDLAGAGRRATRAPGRLRGRPATGRTAALTPAGGTRPRRAIR